jgi:ribosomal protein S19
LESLTGVVEGKTFLPVTINVAFIGWECQRTS